MATTPQTPEKNNGNTLAIILGLLNLVFTFYLFKKQTTMAKAQDRINEFNAQLKTATDQLAEKLRKLSDEIKSGTVTQASLDELDATADRLSAMGTDAEDPTAEGEGTGTGTGTGEGEGTDLGTDPATTDSADATA